MADESRHDEVVVERRDAVVTVTLARPSLTRAVKVALHEVLSGLAGDDGVRAVVLTGSGRTFCAGQDLVEHAGALRADPAHAFDTIDEHYNPIVSALVSMPKPVVAAINGACAGAGLGFALACDLRLAADNARFGTAFTGIGLAPDSGLSATLARAAGVARASELILLAEPFSATQAAEWGIVNRLVPAAELPGAAAALADRLAGGPTRAYAEAKRALAAAFPLAEVLRREGAAQRRLGQTADHQQAVEAFLAKAKPTFSGQ